LQNFLLSLERITLAGATGGRQKISSHTEGHTMSKHTKTQQGVREAGTHIAPAVALLMLSDSVYAQDSSGGPITIVTEPTTLGLLAAGAAVGGAVTYIRSRRRK
jgi:hypothetical protein